MTQILRMIVAYPALFVLQKIVQRFSFYTGLIILIALLFFTNEYISNIFPVSLLRDTTSSNLQEESSEITKEVIIKNGDTLSAILKKQTLPSDEIRELIKLAKTANITSNLKIGQSFVFSYSTELFEDSDSSQEKLVLERMTLQIDKIKSIEFVRQNDKFVVHHISAPLTKLIAQYEATIDTSVIASLKAAGMSSDSITQLINSYSYQIDFQRQIRSGDKIRVITEKFVTSEGELSHHGKILYASLQTQNKNYNIYRYSPTGEKAEEQFFSEDGDSVKSTLLRTPVKIPRVSSKFGYREKHPVLEYGAMHRGVDFAASVGTPIHAAGSGTVSFIGWKSGYGRFVVIKHNGQLSTAYAHASKFATKLKKGSTVKQGDVIAYVGTSGNVTGAHLHYEVLINGKQVDPMKFKSTPGIKLAGTKLAKFEKHKEQVHSLGKKLNKNTELAAADITGIKLF